MSQSNQNSHNFKDTKIFVGGLAWRTTTDDLREYFGRFGEVIDANVVSEGFPGGNIRSKGYGFVVFRDAESANRACQLPYQVVDGRRANVNMAYIGAKNKTNQCNQNGLPHQTGPSHQYPNGLFNQAAPSHQFQPSYQYPTPHFPQPYWAPYYVHHPNMYNVPCYSYSTSMMHHHVTAYRMLRYWQKRNNPVYISAPPNEANEEEADETDSDQEGEVIGEEKDINQDVNDQELEIMSGQDDNTKQDVDVTKQLHNGVEVTLQREIVREEEAENTPQENGNGHEEEEGDEQDRVREEI